MFTFPSQLYPIIDTLGDPQRSAVTLAGAVLDAGIRFLQLRVKDEPTRRTVEVARALAELAHRYGAQLIVNDRADVAALVGAAGVHLGQDDLPAGAARHLLGPGHIIGVSTHNAAQALAAAADGAADYIGFGPIYPTQSKRRPDPVQGIAGLRAVRSRVRIPIVAIGGITATTMHEVLDAGADAVAMIGEIVRAPDVGAQIRRLLAPPTAAGAGGAPDGSPGRTR
jgi:thiamine-phosphate pyrophosphorylase